MTVREAYYEYKSAKRAQIRYSKVAAHCFRNGWEEMGRVYRDESKHYFERTMRAYEVLDDYIIYVNNLGYTQHAWHALRQI